MSKKNITILLAVLCLSLSLLGCGKEAASEPTISTASPLIESTIPVTEMPPVAETALPETTAAEEIPTEDSALPEELAAFDQVFQGTRAIIRAASNESIMLSNISLFFTAEELPWGVAQVAVLDLDADGILEAVLEVENYAGYVILEYQEGTVLGTEIWHRAFQELKADGSFSGAGSSFNRYYWQYSFWGNVLLAERYANEDGSPYYALLGEETEEADFYDFEIQQHSKPAATWYPSWQDYLASR